jgi:hypothetical protein
MNEIVLDEQIVCIRREIVLRQMPSSDASPYEVACMEAVLSTLLKYKAQRALALSRDDGIPP